MKLFEIIKNILDFGEDITNALIEIIKFIPNFFELVIGIINILPTPLDTITHMSITIISAVFLIKIVRGV